MFKCCLPQLSAKGAAAPAEPAEPPPGAQRPSARAQAATARPAGVPIGRPPPRPAPNATVPRHPPRLQAKIDRVRVLLQRAEHAPVPQGLFEYGTAVANLADRNAAPTRQLSALDVANLGHLIAAENARNPGLALEQHRSPEEFIAALAAMKASSARFLFPLHDVGQGQTGTHHIMADVRRQDGETSVVFTEPAVLIGSQGLSHVHLWKAMDAAGTDLRKVGVIEVGAQMSSYGCAMFCLHHAVKSHKNSALFDKLHENLRSEGQITPYDQIRQVDELSVASALDRKDQTHTVPDIYFETEVSFAPGRGVLPADFYKHTHSKTQADAIFMHPVATRMRDNDGLPGRDARVNSSGHEVAETLSERVSAFRVERVLVPGEAPRPTSVSMDGYRLQEVARALDAALGTPVALSKRSTVISSNSIRDDDAD